MPQPPLVRPRSFLLSILSLTLFTAADSRAQEGDDARRAGKGFDLDRAFLLDSTVYAPFYVTETRPLRRALDEGTINAATPLLVMEHRAGPLAFIVDQLAYHHMAQGDIDGEPWMVSF
jgi:hypothetical protein